MGVIIELIEAHNHEYITLKSWSKEELIGGRVLPLHEPT